MSRVIAIDTETFFSKKLKYSLRNLIAEQYCRSPLFDCYIVSASDGKTDWAGHPTQFNWGVLEGATIISHNAYWDRTCYNELIRRGIAPQVKFAAWHCTANLTSYLCNRRALAQAVEYLYKIKVSKEARDDSNNKHWPQDFSVDEQKRMLDYARGDARWCWRLWNDYSAKWPLHEQRLSNMTIEQGQRGVAINAELLDTYIVQSHQMKMATEKLLPWLADVEGEEDLWADYVTKPTSVKCIAEACRRAGIPAPPVKSHYDNGEELYADWENTYKKNNPWISALSSWRTCNRLYKTFLTAKARLRADGTMPFALKYMGAATGRWSGDSGLNFQNFKRRPVYCRQDGLMETDETRAPGDWVRYELDFRKLIVPRKGTVMIVSDLSQVEPRCMAWLCGDKELLALVAQGQSLYEAHARTALGWTGGDLKKENPALYSESKARVLALGYGAGFEKFVAMAAQYTGLDLTAGDPEFLDDEKTVPGWGKRAKEIVADFRARNPKIVGLWNQLDLALKRSVADNLRVALPSGRVLSYEQVKCERRLKPDKKTGKPKLSAVFTADTGRRFEYYGGKLCENLVQATARDVMADGMLRVEAAGHVILWSVHDELIIECAPGTDPKEISDLMSVAPDWMPGIPLAAEARLVLHYCK